MHSSEVFEEPTFWDVGTGVGDRNWESAWKIMRISSIDDENELKTDLNKETEISLYFNFDLYKLFEKDYNSYF